MRSWLVASFLLITNTVFALGPNPSHDWRSADTAHFIFHYEAKHKAQVQKLAAIAETVYPRVTGAFDWQPQARTEVVLLDSFDLANGYATPLPFNHTAIFLSPPDEGELIDNSDWFQLVFSHEFTHIVHLDKARRAPKFMRHIFGRFPFLFPNAWQPTWAIEGLATWVESDVEANTAGTEKNDSIGRLDNAYYDALMRMEVSSGVKSLREINADGRAWPLSKAYLYGAYFYQFMEETYGKKSVYQYVNDYSDNLLPFRVHSNPVASTGKPMDVLWDQYSDWLRSHFGAQQQTLSAQPQNIGTPVASGDWRHEEPTQSADGTLYFLRDDGFKKPQIMRQLPGQPAQSITSVQGGSRLMAHDNTLFIAQPEICDNYNYYFDLYRWNEADGMQRLTHCARYRLVDATGIGELVAVHLDAGQFRIDLLKVDQHDDAQFVRTLYQAGDDEVITAIDASNDGHHVLFSSRQHGMWRVRELNSDSGQIEDWLNDSAAKLSLHYSDDEQSIVFVADYDNRFNAWRMARGASDVQQLTHAYSGVLAVSGLDSKGIRGLTVIGARGTDIYQLNTVASLTNRAIGRNEPAAQASTNADVAISNERNYSALSSLYPRSWFPSGFSGDGAAAFGAQIFGQDTLGVHQYIAAPMYEFTQHEWLGYAQYAYDQRHFLTTARTMTVVNTHDDKDNNPKIDSYKIRSTTQWVSMLPWFSLDRTLLAGIGAAQDNQRYTVVDGDSVSQIDEAVAGVFFTYDSRRQFFRSEGQTNGQMLTLLGETYQPFHSEYTGRLYRADWRGVIGVGSSVVAGRLLALRADHTVESSELGGVFSEMNFGIPLFNQRQFSLRGYDDGYAALRGDNVNLANIEWRLPLSDIDRHFMVPPVGINRLSASVFYERGAAFDKGETPQYFASAGIELLAEIKLGYRIGLPIRLGYAHGLDAQLGVDQFYLSFGRQF